MSRLVSHGCELRPNHCYIRKLPLAGEKAERLMGEIVETKLAPRMEVPVRNAYVPGTGNVDSAKSFVAAANTWWIVKEMPLDP